MEFVSSGNRFCSMLAALVSFCFVCCLSIDTITQTQFIKDPEFLVSSDQVFKLGFFSPNGTTNRYVGIWYNQPKIQALWVANREKPLNDSSGVLRLSQQGNLVVMNGVNQTLWSSNVTNSEANSTVQLLADSGNLVLQGSSGTVLWQSFDHLGDTVYPKNKVSTNLRTRERNYLSSWLTESDPSIGNFTATLVPLNIPEVFIWDNGAPYWRSGPWNGQTFIGIPFMNSVYLRWSMVVVEEGTSYVTFNSSYLATFRLNSLGTAVLWMWDESQWVDVWNSKTSECEVYGKCGPFGSCNAKEDPICSCLRGFVPKNASEWSTGNWTSGCVRRSQLKCERTGNASAGASGNADGFLRLDSMKVPAFSEVENIAEEECVILCSANCSCVAYAYDSGIRCMHWSRELIDVQKFTGTGTSLYIRVAYAELDTKKKDYKVIIISVVAVGVLLLVIGLYLCLRRVAMNKRGRKSTKVLRFNTAGFETPSFSKDDIHSEHIEHSKLQELPLFSLAALAKSTSNFDAANKLGQGGFGPVYMGILENGFKIAVKRLSRSSGQGLKEFMNEVQVISKLQHLNLVRLLGCCVERDEKILVYEYMPNKSLDVFLFDAEKKQILEWEKRFEIITGIGRGLVYLHRDSRPRIIHRDLKAGNILLDEDLNPKISDFGMARIFQSKQNQADTLRVVGTYGYMSPEYAMDGRFSEKSDVFSFGVLLLEIVSGRKNTSFYDEEDSSSLIGFAWKLWKEGSIEPLIDAAISSPNAGEEIRRCVHVGLLCVQESALDRPSVSTVLSMLSSEIADLPTPKQPAFVLIQTTAGSTTSTSSSAAKVYSTNDVTVSKLQGR